MAFERSIGLHQSHRIEHDSGSVPFNCGRGLRPCHHGPGKSRTRGARDCRRAIDERAKRVGLYAADAPGGALHHRFTGEDQTLGLSVERKQAETAQMRKNSQAPGTALWLCHSGQEWPWSSPLWSIIHWTCRSAQLISLRRVITLRPPGYFWSSHLSLWPSAARRSIPTFSRTLMEPRLSTRHSAVITWMPGV
jgi:hypothetical protein